MSVLGDKHKRIRGMSILFTSIDTSSECVDFIAFHRHISRTCIENAIFLSRRKVYVQKNGFSTHIGLLQFHLKSAYFGGFGLTHWGIMCQI